jgi:hypothetical protein
MGNVAMGDGSAIQVNQQELTNLAMIALTNYPGAQRLLLPR